MESGIYLIINIISHKEYAGSSKALGRRKYLHFYSLKRGENTNPQLQSDYNLYGRDAFVFVVVEHCEPADLRSREKWWVDLLDLRNPEKGYNILDPVRGRTGTKHLLETVEKIVATRRANDSYHHTDETKAAISQTKKANPTRYWQGRSRSPETREKLRQANLGKKWSPETREKRRQTALRKRSEIDQRRAVTRVSTLERNG